MRGMIGREVDPGLAQLRRGASSYCVLALWARGERYGFDIARTMADLGLVAGQGTIYPLLSRLGKDGLVETLWRESPSGPPGWNYRLTEDGLAAVKTFRSAWIPFRNVADHRLETMEESEARAKAPAERPSIMKGRTSSE